MTFGPLKDIVDHLHPHHDAPVQKPSIGRIVVYNHPGSADGTYPVCQSPAIVQHVNEDGTCFLWVFGRYGVQFQPTAVQGDGPCQWNWPPRV